MQFSISCIYINALYDSLFEQLCIILMKPWLNFTKTPMARIFTNFEGRERAKEPNFLVKLY